MSTTSANLGLTIWTSANDTFDYNQLAANLTLIDAAFTGIKGSQLATGINGSPGTVLSYIEPTPGNISITATSEATANTIATAGAISFNGTVGALIRFFTPEAIAGTTSITVVLYDGAASIGIWGIHNNATKGAPFLLERQITPTNASHTYSVRAFVDAGTGTVVNGAGGVGANMPAFIRITKV